MAGFLQTRTGSSYVGCLLSVSNDKSSVDRDMLAAFLSEGDGASCCSQSGEIFGILKQMRDDMAKDLADLRSQEGSAKADMMLAWRRGRKSLKLTQAIEEKTERVGNIAMELATKANDLEDIMEGLTEDKKFLADQAMELAALADTINVLNDDDAPELFKKTSPSAASSLSRFKRAPACVDALLSACSMLPKCGAAMLIPVLTCWRLLKGWQDRVRKDCQDDR